MRKMIIGLMATLAVVLGSAAPANAVVISGTGHQNSDGSGLAVELIDSTGCRDFTGTLLEMTGAKSGTVLATASGNVRFFSDDECQTTLATLPRPTAVPTTFGGDAAFSYKTVAP